MIYPPNWLWEKNSREYLHMYSRGLVGRAKVTNLIKSSPVYTEVAEWNNQLGHRISLGFSGPWHLFTPTIPALFYLSEILERIFIQSNISKNLFLKMVDDIISFYRLTSVIDTVQFSFKSKSVSMFVSYNFLFKSNQLYRPDVFRFTLFISRVQIERR